MHQTSPSQQRRSQRALRQARVGIVANPVETTLPVFPPREVWSKWPKLRSARRRSDARTAAGQEVRPDPVLSGEMLRSFAQDMRKGDLGSVSVVEASQPDAADFVPVLTRARPVIRLALAVLLFGLALIGLALGWQRGWG